jgi:lipopolysaccharide export system permease protein
VRTLTRYLLVRFLGSLLAILGVILITLVITSLLLDFDDVLDPERGLVWTLVKLLLQIPAEFLRTVLPISALAAALACFGISARWLEVTAMKAGGISPIRAAAPVLVAAFLLSGVSLAVDQTVSVEAARALNRHMHGGQDEQISLGRGSFWYHRGNDLYNIQESDPDRGVLRGILIYERSPEGRLLRSIDAASAKTHGGRQWILQDAVVRSFDPTRPSAPPDLQRFAEMPYALGGQKDLKLLDASASALSLRELRRYIQERKRQGANVDRFRTLEQERVTEPFTLLLFVLLAIPLGMRVEDYKSLAVPALQGVALAALYLFTRSLASTLAAQGVTPPAASIWIVLVGFLGFGTWRLLRVPR